MTVHNAGARWQQLDARRQDFLKRCERYASVTLPKMCLPDHVTQENSSLQLSFQSLGAQAVNHLTNKAMLALFRPSAPFFRLDPSPELARKLGAMQIPEEALREALVDGETRAVRRLDQLAIRPKLHETVKHLIVTGNALLDLSDKDAARVMGIRRYVCKRSKSGKLIEFLTKEKVLYDELEDDAQRAIGKIGAEDNEVCFYLWARLKGGMWSVEQWVDDKKLPDEGFTSRYSVETFPYHVLTWDLADEHDYGTGLVEEYSGDFTTLETLSECEIKAAILASEFRWLADPAGVMNTEDLKHSRAGDVIPGRKDDLQLVSMVGRGALDNILPVAERVIRRIGSAFLLGSAVTRQAERVTAEEVRMQAQELESSLGGVYSRLAIDLQLPLVRWLLADQDVQIEGTELIPTIVTGLEALSRNADAASLSRFISEAAQIATFPPELLATLKIDSVLSTLAAANGLVASRYVKPQAQVAQEMQQARQAETDAAAQQAVAQEGAKAMANPI